VRESERASDNVRSGVDAVDLALKALSNLRITFSDCQERNVSRQQRVCINASTRVGTFISATSCYTVNAGYRCYLCNRGLSIRL